MHYTKQGNKIFYKIFGSGAKTFILLHNAGGNHQFLRYQIEALSKVGQIIAIDLLGHGSSDKPLKQYTVSGFAEDIIELCNHLNVKEAVAIGLNYGADVLLQLAVSQHDTISKLVLIDPPLLMKQETIDRIQDHILHLNDSEMTEYAEELVAKSFINTSEENKEIARSSFANCHRQILSSIYTDLLQWDQSSKNLVSNLRTPSLCILTDGSLCSGSDLQQINPQIKIGKVVGSLYWAALEVPDQVNSMLLRFLEI